MVVRLVTITPNAETLIVKCARVSSPNPNNPEYEGLVKYLIKHQHWSPFELGHAVIEIGTSRAIAAQILRHRSFSFQEFSQRYSSDIDEPSVVDGRKQAIKNRQSSSEDLTPADQLDWHRIQDDAYKACFAAYDAALELGVAREQARMLLPLATPTRLYMAGTIRSWIHYCDLRCQPDTQLEHRQIAGACRSILAEHLPIIGKALNWL